MPGKSALHYVRYLLNIERAQTQLTAAERAALARYAAGRRRLVEIGVFEGASTRLLAESMAIDGILHAVDPFMPGRLGVCWAKGIARRELKKIRPARNAVLLEMFSYDAAKKLAGSFDLVFIDGDHSLDGIQRDWDDWSARIEAGGIVALHDTCIPHPSRVPADYPKTAELGSYRYFESSIRHDARFELVEQVDALSVLRRR